MTASDPKRRQFLQASLISMGAIGLIPGRSRSAAEASLRWHPLGENTAVVSGSESNALVCRGQDGVMLIDAAGAGQAQTLLQLVEDRFAHGLPQLLFNTHWHHPHTACNGILGKNGATIIAHENTRLWLTTEVVSIWESRTYRPLPEFAQPNQTFYHDTQQITYNKETIEYGLLPQAHTDGDIYVFFPSQNILVAGGVVAGERYPLVDYCSNGWLGGMVEALKTLIGLADNETVIIPASGQPCGINALNKQLRLCEALIEKIARHYYSGGTYQEFIASNPIPETLQLADNPETFLHTAYEGAWWHVRELRRWARG